LRDSLSVEVKVREVDPKAFEASASEVALATAAQGWMIHLLVLGAVLAIATVYVGVHIGKGWVPATTASWARARCA